MEMEEILERIERRGDLTVAPAVLDTRCEIVRAAYRLEGGAISGNEIVVAYPALEGEFFSQLEAEEVVDEEIGNRLGFELPPGFFYNLGDEEFYFISHTRAVEYLYQLRDTILAEFFVEIKPLLGAFVMEVDRVDTSAVYRRK